MAPEGGGVRPSSQLPADPGASLPKESHTPLTEWLRSDFILEHDCGHDKCGTGFKDDLDESCRVEIDQNIRINYEACHQIP